MTNANLWLRLLRACRITHLGVAVAALSGAPSATAQAASDHRPDVLELAPRIYALTESKGNLLVVASDSGALIAGVQRPTLVEGAKQLLDSLRAGPPTYVIVADGDSADIFGDGGWRELGAITLAHEGLYLRMDQLARSKHGLSTPSFRNALPTMGFSAVVQLYPKGEEVHVIRPRAGATDADVVVHVENAGVVYLGNTFTNDGYPAIHLDKRGSLPGLITTVDFFVNTFAANPGKIEPIIPGRGAVASIDDLRSYRDMLTTVRDRVETLRKAGRSVDEVVAAKPTLDLDARWGGGPVSSDQFVRMVYNALSK